MDHDRLVRPGSLFPLCGVEGVGRLILIALLLLAVGCATAPVAKYREEYDIRIKVVYLDRDSIHEEYEKLSMLPAVIGGREVKAFYDPKTNTLYCEKWDFKYCGHELHHATDGSWHAVDR